MHSGTPASTPASILRSLAIAAVAVAFSLTGCRSTPPPDDTSLNAAVQSRLANDAALGAEPIQTFVHNGVATLQGAVSSQAARALAAGDASQVPGIKSVVNDLTVQTAQQAPPPFVPPVFSPPAPPPAQDSSKPSPMTARRSARPTPPAAQSAPIERQTPPPSSQPSPQPGSQTAQQLPPPSDLPPLQHHQTTPPPPAFRNLTVPSGTTLPVRITQTLDSGTTQPGDTFSGSVASDIVIDGLVAIPAGTTVNGRVDEVHEAAHFKGSALLTVSLVGLNRRGDHTTITTDPYTQEGKGRGKNTAEKVGGGAAVGAILGGIFGGGKGAAIGAAAGGGVGAGAQGITRGQQVQIPSETLIRFRLSNSIDVRASVAATAPVDAQPSTPRQQLTP